MSKLIEVKEPPRNGDQFIITWFFGGWPWCESARYRGKRLEVYLDDLDDFAPWTGPADRVDSIQYWVADAE